MEMLNKEREVLGMFLSGHPLDEFRPELQGFTTTSLAADDLERKVGNTVFVGGVVTKMRSVETKRGDTIGFGQIQDFHGETGLFFKKDEWEKFRDIISQDDRILVKGVLEHQRDKDRKEMEETQIIVEDAYQLDYVRSAMVNYVHVSFYSQMLNEEFLVKLEEGLQRFEAFEGEHSCKLVCHIETDSFYEHGLVLHKYKLGYNQELMNWLKRDMGVLKLWVSGKPRR